MKALISFETLATIHPTTQRHIHEYRDARQLVYLKKEEFSFKLSTEKLAFN
jgi:hypothetical protein